MTPRVKSQLAAAARRFGLTGVQLEDLEPAAELQTEVEQKRKRIKMAAAEHYHAEDRALRDRAHNASRA